MESNSGKVFDRPLLDAGTSLGADLEEAKAGQSTKDLVHKNQISLKEARESGYWRGLRDNKNCREDSC